MNLKRMLETNWKYYIGLIVAFVVMGLIIPGTFLDILSVIAYPAMLAFFIFFYTVGASQAALKQGSVKAGLNSMSRLVAILPVIVIVLVMGFFDFGGHHFIMNIGSLIVTWFALRFFIQRAVLYQDAGVILRQAQITGSTGQGVNVGSPSAAPLYTDTIRPAPVVPVAPVASVEVPTTTTPNDFGDANRPPRK